jgi:drug/metabolite transporter (DMT)-like permease
MANMMNTRRPSLLILTLLLISLIPSTSGFITPSPQVVAPFDDCKAAVAPLSTTTTRLASSSDQEGATTTAEEDRSAGLLVLLSVPLAWGTYSPVVKYLYEVRPAVPGIVFSAAYYIVASILLNFLCLAETTKQEAIGDDDVATSSNFSLKGGLELGSYLFIANALQVKGLETVPSSRAGFIVQLTTIMVPLMQAFSNGVSVPIRTWIACILAFAGVVVMGFDGGKELDLIGGVAGSAISQGDLLIVGAAVLYSLHVVRLGRYAAETTPLKLAASKATTEAFLSIGVVTALFMGQLPGGQEISNFFQKLSSGWVSGDITLTTLTPAIGAVIWTGFITCAYTIYAQSYGQARVSPTEANLIYTIQPLFTALFGYFLLGETLGQAGMVGAVLIASAVYAVADFDTKGDDDSSGSGDEDDIKRSVSSKSL